MVASERDAVLVVLVVLALLLVVLVMIAVPETGSETVTVMT